MPKIIPVILCGGSGTRLWPLSREDKPKQFLSLTGEHSLLQETIQRAQRVSDASSDEIICVTLAATKEELTRQLNALDPALTRHILYEPSARNTAAAVALAAHYIASQFGQDSIMWILPADHHILDEQALQKSFQDLMTVITSQKKNYVATFGFIPHRPETGYGYIRLTDQILHGVVRQVAEFIEKPDYKTALDYIKQGDYLWNSGMFLFQADIILSYYHLYAPAIIQEIEKAFDQETKNCEPEIYHNIASVSFDDALMVHLAGQGKVAVCPCNLGWSDVGSWESLWEIGKKDPHGNVIQGTAAMYNSHNCLVHTKHHLVTCTGLDNIIIIEADDALMVANKSAGDDIKTLVNSLKKAGRKEVYHSPKSLNPWDMIQRLCQSGNYDMKDITINKNDIITSQIPPHQKAFWIIIEGTAEIIISGQSHILEKQTLFSIPQNTSYRLVNTGQTPLRIMEVQYSDHVDQDNQQVPSFQKKEQDVA